MRFLHFRYHSGQERCRNCERAGYPFASKILCRTSLIFNFSINIFGFVVLASAASTETYSSCQEECGGGVPGCWRGKRSRSWRRAWQRRGTWTTRAWGWKGAARSGLPRRRSAAGQRAVPDAGSRWQVLGLGWKRRKRTWS